MLSVFSSAIFFMTLVVDDISSFPNTKELNRLRKTALFVIVGTGATGRTTFREILSSTIFFLQF